MRCVTSSAWGDCGPHLTTPGEWVGGEVTSNHYVNDQEAGRGQKGQLARTSGWNSTYLQCHPIHHGAVQSTLFNVWTPAKAPSWPLLPHLEECRGPQEWHLCQVCGRIHGHCLRLIKGHPPRDQDPVDGRGPMTEMVLWPENRCCGSEAWQSGPSQGQCLPGKEED